MMTSTDTNGGKTILFQMIDANDHGSRDNKYKESNENDRFDEGDSKHVDYGNNDNRIMMSVCNGFES